MKRSGLLCGITSVFVFALTVWGQPTSAGDSSRAHYGRMWDVRPYRGNSERGSGCRGEVCPRQGRNGLWPKTDDENGE